MFRPFIYYSDLSITFSRSAWLRNFIFVNKFYRKLSMHTLSSMLITIKMSSISIQFFKLCRYGNFYFGFRIFLKISWILFRVSACMNYTHSMNTLLAVYKVIDCKMLWVVYYELTDKHCRFHSNVRSLHWVYYIGF